ncbi:ABC transporter permease [Barnesiella sp. WM24]|uniref:ABC transporter permease n=1 Tax=Barnesiella sp. WM24 TaxID=2558278 RepID=UPI001071A042|nr:ABC transporter permease [Barnesiella sp. WM24]TFU94471.1 ABC transporter permease [Barnesiella sp. WM24]
MSILQSLIKKEALHVFRDRRTMVITLLMPVLLLLLFGFAISTEVNNVNVVAVVDRHTDETREIIERFSVNPYITFKGVTDNSNADNLLRTGTTDAVVVLKTSNGRLSTQIIVDASNTTVAQASTAYIRGIISGSDMMSPVLTQTLYNPQLKSAYNFVPGIMGMIFILICAIMTSVSIVSEKENGTMDLLLVSPVRPGTVILVKLIPYFILSCTILAVMLIISYTVLELPLSSSIINVILLSIIYIILSLSIGLLVSTVVDTQLTALIVSAVVFMLPVIMLSGMIFPIDNMPVVLQWLSCIIPARWYTAAMRKLMIQQLEINYVLQEISILLSMTGLLLLFALKKFNTRK